MLPGFGILGGAGCPWRAGGSMGVPGFGVPGLGFHRRSFGFVFLLSVSAPFSAAFRRGFLNSQQKLRQRFEGFAQISLSVSSAEGRGEGLEHNVPLGFGSSGWSPEPTAPRAQEAASW